VSAWPLECLLHIEFYSSIHDIFMFWVFLLVLFSLFFLFLIFLLVLLSFFSMLLVFLLVLLTFFSVLLILLLMLFSLFFLFLVFLLILYLSFPCFWFFFLLFVWTSVLPFCLIVLVFARMSLRVNYTARRFLMIIQACWVSVRLRRQAISILQLENYR